MLLIFSQNRITVSFLVTDREWKDKANISVSPDLIAILTKCLQFSTNRHVKTDMMHEETKTIYKLRILTICRFKRFPKSSNHSFLSSPLYLLSSRKPELGRKQHLADGLRRKPNATDSLRRKQKQAD